MVVIEEKMFLDDDDDDVQAFHNKIFYIKF